MQARFNTLVLPGGGIKGLTLLGGLHYLYTETDHLKGITIYSGASIGALINVFLALGFSPLHIFTKSYHYDKALSCDLKDVFAVLGNYGLKSNEHIIDFAFDIIREDERYEDTITPSTTLQEVYEITGGDKKGGKTLYFATANLSEDKMMYFSHKTHPLMPLKLAMRMTANIPFIYSKIQCDVSVFLPGGKGERKKREGKRKNVVPHEESSSDEDVDAINAILGRTVPHSAPHHSHHAAHVAQHVLKKEDENDYFVDGGLLDNCPIACVDDGVNTVLVLDINKTNKKGHLGLFEYFYKIVTLPAKYSHARTKNTMSNKCKLFDLEEIDFNVLGVNSSLKDRQDVFDKGYARMHKLVCDMEMAEYDAF